MTAALTADSIKRSKRRREPADLARAASRALSAAPKRQPTPAALQLQEALRSVKKPGRFPVADKEARTIDGVVFDSAKEARRFAELRLLERTGRITELKRQVALAVMIGGKSFCKFTCDFSYREHPSETLVYEELKSTGSVKDAAYKLRKRAAELYHDIAIREVLL